MRIPWVPLEQGGGVHPPTLAERIFVGANGQPDYGTAKNPIERKAFQNLPMPCKDAMNIYEPNLHKGPHKGTGLRHGQRALEGAGENYVDSFVTHPIAGNYEKLFAGLEEQKKEAALEHTPQLTLEMVARRGFTNLGLNADEERMNSLRDRLRFMGASDEEIETQLKEARQKRLKEMVGREMIPEERELHAADAWARQMGVHPEQGAFNFGARPFHDANVFNFGTPAPSHYAGFQSREGPDNAEFVPSGARGIRGSGVHSISVIDGNVDAEEAEAKTHGAMQLALSKQGPELMSRTVKQVRAHGIFVNQARRVYEANLPLLLSKKKEAEQALLRARTYKEGAYPRKKLRETNQQISELQRILGEIESGKHQVIQPLRLRGRPKKK
jgi:hypothetical protein